MRPVLFAGLVLLIIPAAAFAQAGPYYAVVVDEGVKLRAGPSDKFPDTATLRKGTQLFVDHEEENGWLAVQNLPGQLHSVSWVQGSLVDFDNTKPTPQNVVVDETGAALRVGQVGLAQPLPITRLNVPAGTSLAVIGPKVQFEGKGWYPVMPPAGDFRYIPKQSVTQQKTANAAFAVRDSIPEKNLPPAIGNPGASSPVASIPGPGSGAGSLPPPAGETGSSSNKPTVQNPLWAQAEAAEREGRYDEAEKLYFQLARQMNEPGGDHDIANLCYTRIHAIREKKRGGTNFGNSGTSSSSGNSAPIVPVTRPVTGTNEKPPPGPPPAEPKEERGKWTGPGRLVRSALAIDGRRTYALETSPGVVVMYIVPGTGIELERFVNKKVDIYGVSATRRDLSKPFVVATTVEPAQ